ncbi:hypothetical protein ACWEF9_00760 [Streptomyces sp. NPDC004980]
MNHSENIDHDAVLRARTLLLGSGGITVHQEADAYRILARVSPATYLPRLARTLLTFSYRGLEKPELRLSVLTEAVAAARRMDGAEPNRAALLTDTLDACRHELYTLGRRAEAFALCEEMAHEGRRAFEAGHVASPVYAHDPLATALAEEGRHEEAARLFGEIARVARAEGDPSAVPFWPTVAWVAELDAAGRHGEAVDAFASLVEAGRERLDRDGTSLAMLVWKLVRLAGMLDADGRRDEAHTARKEALGLLTELAGSGERRGWSNILSWWRVLLALSGRTDEQPVPGEPAPAYGVNLGWSPDVRKAYLDGREPLTDAIDALSPPVDSEPDRHRLAEMILLQRKLTIRSVMYWESRTHLILDPLRPLFDEGVALARRLAVVDDDRGPAALARALTDRSTLLVAGKRYGEALADFREAVELT